eukprot:4307135-Pleurochrysis_carterae.AAC.1
MQRLDMQEACPVYQGCVTKTGWDISAAFCEHSHAVSFTYWVVARLHQSNEQYTSKNVVANEALK